MAPQAGGFMRTFGMAMLGGLVGSMLFSGLAGAGLGGLGGLGGSGFGMIEMLLLAGLGYFIYRKFRSSAAATNHGSMEYRSTQYQEPANPGLQRAVKRSDTGSAAIQRCRLSVPHDDGPKL